MRKLEKLLDGKRHTFTATFQRFGMKHGYKGPVKTLVVTDVCCEGETLADYLWFTCGKSFEKLKLKEGDKIQFDARVDWYERGYFGNREDVYCPTSEDVKLVYPTKLIKLKEVSK